MDVGFGFDLIIAKSNQLIRSMKQTEKKQSGKSYRMATQEDFDRF